MGSLDYKKKSYLIYRQITDLRAIPKKWYTFNTVIYHQFKSQFSVQEMLETKSRDLSLLGNSTTFPAQESKVLEFLCCLIETF